MKVRVVEVLQMNPDNLQTLFLPGKRHSLAGVPGLNLSTLCLR